MKERQKLLEKARLDLAINAQYRKGQKNKVRRVWHFCSDGNAIDVLFGDEKDFLYGMNRLYVLVQHYDVLILAFTLMDTHFHFVLYGEYDECVRFVREYVRRTSMYISIEHNLRKKLRGLPITCQAVTDDIYLKRVICYVVKNAPMGGRNYLYYDYPWSSGPLYFRKNASWAFHGWNRNDEYMTTRIEQKVLRTHVVSPLVANLSGKIIFPGEFVETEIVEDLFRTVKAFTVFMGATKYEDIEAEASLVSRLSVPMPELRQLRMKICKETFGVQNIGDLDVGKRLKLAKILKRKFDCSPKILAKSCGLVYEEVRDIL